MNETLDNQSFDENPRPPPSFLDDIMRGLRGYDNSSYFYYWNFSSVSDSTDFDGNLKRPADVSVDAVVSSMFFNAVVFVILMISYECLRRMFPSVYSSRKKMHRMRHNHNGTFVPASSSDEEDSKTKDSKPPFYPGTETREDNRQNSSQFEKNVDDKNSDIKNVFSKLPDEKPLDWIRPVLGIPWNHVLKSAGLDGYFFLRYIRMCVRITAVSSFWFFLILVPIYATGGAGVTGWYHLSAANLKRDDNRLWAPVIFWYLFTFFICFVVKQEYRHYLDLRQDFLAKGSEHVHPQHHYSLLVESIPYELRSDRALADYFNKLFPGRVHSASVVLKLPDLEDASARCLRSCRRLEKSIALLHATGKRPTHYVGQGRLSVLGIDLLPFDCSVNCSREDILMEDHESQDSTIVMPPSNISRPKRGTRVDSISYYTQELAMHSRELFRMQKRKAEIAESGNLSIKADNWLDSVVREAAVVANRILDDSAIENSLVAPHDAYEDAGIAEHMTSRYGSISPVILYDHGRKSNPPKTVGLDAKPSAAPKVIGDPFGSTEAEKKAHLIDDYSVTEQSVEGNFTAPFGSDQYRSALRRWMGRLGLDFLISILKGINSQLDFALEGVIGATMSSTGMVTFLDLSSVACAASAPLTVKANILNVTVAPEPREIIWGNAHVPKKSIIQRESVANIVLFFGVVLWSFPLAAIQAFAKADFLAQIPGMDWILTLHGGKFSSFVNGYLPVVALLILIMILPVIFEYVALKYERRKTLSDVQASMLGRYFYYQLANIYVSVTAGSILKSLADIIDHPSNILQLLGESLPTMAGYFVALLVTKILAGLPMIFLRFGALCRLLFLRLLSDEKKLTQREIDAIYRLENVQYGWEFPTQLLVILIVFTYAVMCPVILPVGLVYFMGALAVYKKQILYVYSPVYESGGAMFPQAVQRTLFGLVCGQLTFLGYLVTRGCYYQPVLLFPLPVLTVFASNYFESTYAEPSKKLSLERARACDRLSSLVAFKNSSKNLESTEMPKNDYGTEVRNAEFDKNSYRQPVLTELAKEPWTYRRHQPDDETMRVRSQLRLINRSISKSQLRHAVTAIEAVHAIQNV